MNTNRSRTTMVLALVIAAVGANSARAVTITVPGDQPTIQDAISVAGDGDTILVDDGVYTENITLDVPNLTLLSVNGRSATTLTYGPGAGVPLVEIAAPGVTLGAAGQGFTMIHEDANPTSIVRINSADVGLPGATNAGALRIEDNRLRGSAAGSGILSDAALSTVEVAIVNNLMDRLNGAVYSFDTAMLFDHSTPPGASDSTLYSASLSILGNTVQFFQSSAVSFAEDINSSTLLVQDNEFTGLTGGAGYGLHAGHSARDASEIIISRNSIADVGIGILLHTIIDGTNLTTTYNVISNFHERGISANFIYYGSDAVLSGNELSGDSQAEYGIYQDYLDEGCTLRMDNNTVSGVALAGIYQESSNFTPTLSIQGNNIDTNNAESGISLGSHVATNLELRGNQVSGFAGSGIYSAGGFSEGCNAVIADNTLTGNGAESGIEVDAEVSNGSDLSVTGNTVANFSEFGILIYRALDGSNVQVENNSLTASPGGTFTDGIRADDIEDGSALEIKDNTVDLSGSQDNGIKIVLISGGSDVTISGNDVRNFLTNGLLVESEVEGGSTLTVAGNSFLADSLSPADDGIRIDDYVQYGSLATITENTIGGFTGIGIYVYTLYEGSDLVCDSNIVTGSEDGAEYGIHLEYLQYGALDSSISGNTVSNVRDSNGGSAVGIYVYDLYEGCFLDIKSNTVTAHPAGAQSGIKIDSHEYGSVIDVEDNTVSGFILASLHLDDDIADGAILNVTENQFEGAEMAVLAESNVQSGGTLTIRRNTLSGFSAFGVSFAREISEGAVSVEGNKISGDSAPAGIKFTAPVSEVAQVNLNDNCFNGVDTGVSVDEILDSAQVTLRGNDFSGVAGDGVQNVNSDADHPVDAEDNFFGGSAVSGNVAATRQLTIALDSDGDGVGDCDDQCPDTPLGVAVDDNGCPLPVQPPDNNGQPDPPEDNGCGAGSATGFFGLFPAGLIGMGRFRLRRRRRVSR